MGTLVILGLLGAVALGLIGWVAHHVRRELIRQHQVTRVRSAIESCASVSPSRCPYCPQTPAGAGSAPELPAPAGCIAESAA